MTKSSTQVYGSPWVGSSLVSKYKTKLKLASDKHTSLVQLTSILYNPWSALLGLALALLANIILGRIG